MIQRKMFRAYCKGGELENLKQQIIINQKQFIAEGISTLSLFNEGNQLFVYYETEGKAINPEQLLRDYISYLSAWPDEVCVRYFVPMMDIFHYNKPIENQEWRQEKANKQSWGRIAKLRPEKVSSYIFYHYQYQEEKCGDGDKYGIIGLNEALLFFYIENPETKEEPCYKGTLATHHTPSNWSEVMEPHFEKWQDVSKEEEIWKTLNLIVRIDESESI